MNWQRRSRPKRARAFGWGSGSTMSKARWTTGPAPSRWRASWPRPGTDAWQLLEWLGPPEQTSRARGPKVQLLRRVFAEPFDVRPGAATPVSKEQVLASAAVEPTALEAVAGAVASTPLQPETHAPSSASDGPTNPPRAEADLPRVPGTEPALVRGHDVRHARYRGLAKTKLRTTSPARPAT